MKLNDFSNELQSVDGTVTDHESKLKRYLNMGYVEKLLHLTLRSIQRLKYQGPNQLHTHLQFLTENILTIFLSSDWIEVSVSCTRR